jgi:hypothetical protein
MDDVGEAQGALPGEFDTRHMLKRLLELAVFLGVLCIAILSFPGLDTLRHRSLRLTPLCSSSSGC